MNFFVKLLIIFSLFYYNSESKTPVGMIFLPNPIFLTDSTIVQLKNKSLQNKEYSINYNVEFDSKRNFVELKLYDVYVREFNLKNNKKGYERLKNNLQIQLIHNELVNLFKDKKILICFETIYKEILFDNSFIIHYNISNEQWFKEYLYQCMK